MMNTDILQEFQARPTPTQKAEPVCSLGKEDLSEGLPLFDLARRIQ